MLKVIFTKSWGFPHFTLVPILEFLFLFFILPLVACPLMGQVVQKKCLSPSEYSLWGEVHLDKISYDEKWTSYRNTYENSQDTLFIQNIVTGRKLSVIGAEKTLFTSGNFFIYNNTTNLNILNLKTLKTETIPKVKQFLYDKKTDKLVIFIGDAQENGTLLVKPLGKAGVVNFKGVSQLALSPIGGKIAFTASTHSGHAIAVLNLEQLNNVKWIADSSEQFIGLTWEDNGKALAFLRQSADQNINALGLYVLSAEKSYELDPNSCSDFPQKSSIYFDAFTPIVISSDLKRVFFAIKNETSSSEDGSPQKVEIWNSNDKRVRAQEKYAGRFDAKPKVALWNPNSNHVNLITSNELPLLMLSGDMKYAVLSDPDQHEPQFKVEEIRDIYVMDLSTFEKKMVLEKYVYVPLELNISPSGKYFSYFKENSWWVYDFVLGTHKNVSEKIGVKFTGKAQELVPESAYGNPGWSLNDKEILLYDQFDIWAVSPDGKTSSRITKGRESGIKLRVAKASNGKGLKFLFDGLVSESFDLSEELLLRGSGSDGKTGYFKWMSGSRQKALTYGDYYTDDLNYSPKKRTFFFREQKFDSPPQLLSSSVSGDKKSFYKSNSHHKNYFWGRSELIEFENAKGRNLKGVLFYPAEYDPKIKYPMIVSIYESQSRELHIYENPTYYNGAGFNITLATAAGYFVFLPDIHLEYQNPGLSAADCVISGVKKVIEKGIVKQDKIGLRGHSFGGFESAFIISHTDLFATVITSGAITDLFSDYHSLGPRAGIPEIWRYTTEQYNMGKSPYEIPEMYAANSPIIHVPKIDVPVLLWTGENDPQVDPRQSYEFYLALRQLRKKSVMLIYPKAGHVLMKPDQQKDATVRTLEWFDYHLKDNHSYSWIADAMK
ncbi:prolyl oligopeptidase family serine peptidase [Flavobacterium sp. AC]|uniref:Prolyl oligopeptidase family serine peptidase n=1 Tax=Flavobacterium azizsancarii TaxID=2961580 RepID=A0ABT4WAE8_9FLAO|nr:prolyl oligopeptidase family serine peptidase [Flavobacterium azizsancarii]MDA6069539.1 prolyl oligopeptidase family serine peptidase [Flavobacterium azizsancarii]